MSQMTPIESLGLLFLILWSFVGCYLSVLAYNGD